jgi:hypothetical protein
MEIYGRVLLPRLLAEDRRARSARLSRALSRSCSVLFGGLVAAAALDRFWPMASWARECWWVALASGAIVMAIPAVAGWFGAADLPAAAARLERRLSLPREALMTVVSEELRPTPGVARALLIATAELVVQEMAERPPEPADRAGRRRWWLAAALGAGVAVAATFDTTSFLRAALPWEARESATGTRIRVLPGDAEVLQGQSISVSASVENSPGPAYLELSRDESMWVRMEMSPRGASTYVAALPPLEQDLLYRVRAGGACSETYDVRVRVPSERRPRPQRAATTAPSAREDSAIEAYRRRMEAKP